MCPDIRLRKENLDCNKIIPFGSPKCVFFYFWEKCIRKLFSNLPFILRGVRKYDISYIRGVTRCIAIDLTIAYNTEGQLSGH